MNYYIYIYIPFMYSPVYIYTTGNAVYSNTETDVIQLGVINADIYDYPTLSTIDTKPSV